MASSSTSFVQKSFKYDVFLSFRGEDTRKTFVDHLFNALQQKSIHTYKDDERIKKGEKISDELIKSIEDSKLYIIVFSKNYASSSWCLQELAKIMECQKKGEHSAYPVFYDVEPTEVRKQSGEFGKAFAKQEKEEAAEKWRETLKEASELAGWELKNTLDGHEAKFIKKIVEEISLELRSISISIDEKLVGMETRIKDVVSSLEMSIDDVRMIGIKGIGGGGKTTLARAVFDRISFRFEGSSFVENVRENSNPNLSGLKKLQEQVLKDVLHDKDIYVSSVSDGKNKMKKMMSCRKVLVVLDDVDHREQLEALAGELHWFKLGSRIIITTRDEQVLVAHGVNLICDVNLLSDEEAICLFNRYAFRRKSPIQEYKELSGQVVGYAGGLPLTITVLGSFLCGKDELEWKDAIERLKTIPLKETLEKLELSYISLEEDYKEIFLDVACILKGWEKDEAITMLESCGFRARNGLKVLEQKSLITITESKYWNVHAKILNMHDSIEEMGKNIVRRKHEEPNKHSRLWINEEIEDVLVSDQGTNEAIRCIKLDTSEVDPEIVMKGFGNMKKLRFLQVENRYGDYLSNNWKFDEDLPSFPNALRSLRWTGYPFRSLPKSFQANNLVELEMQGSKIVQLWEGEDTKVLNKLRFLDLGYSKLKNLDLCLTKNLETLDLNGCKDLVKLHMPVECPKLRSLKVSNSKLTTLDLRGTPNLEKLTLWGCNDLVELHIPSERLKLKYVGIDCSKLTTLDLRGTPYLETLTLQCCIDLVELHIPSERLKLKSVKINSLKLTTLDLRGTPNLETLTLQYCNDLVELHIPSERLKLKSVEIIGSKLTTLDLRGTPNLEYLKLDECVDLVELHIPSERLKLKSVEINHLKLTTLDLRGTPNLETLALWGSNDLVELHIPSERLKLKSVKIDHSKLTTLDLRGTPNLETLTLRFCNDLVKLHIPSEHLKLKSVEIFRLKLTTLDLRGTPNLETLTLWCCNDLVELHIPSERLKLKSVGIDGSKLTTLDLRGTPNLEYLTLRYCNDLVELHIPRERLKLKYVEINRLKLTTLDLRGTPNLEELNLLACVDLVELQIPGERLKLKSVEINGSKLTTLDLRGTPNLETLTLQYCNDLVELHIPSERLKLKSVEIIGSKLTTLDLRGTPNLEYLKLDECVDLVELHIPSEHLKLKSVEINRLKLTTLDLRGTPNLETLTLWCCNDLVELHIPSERLKLKSVGIDGSKLTTLDLLGTPNLETLTLRYCNDLVELHIPRERLKLKSVEINRLKLTTLDLRGTPNLETLTLWCCNDLVELHIPSERLKLKSVEIDGSKLTTLDLRGTPNLEKLTLDKCVDLVELHIPGEGLKLESIEINGSKLTTLDLRGTPNLKTLFLTKCYHLVEVYAHDGCLKNLDYIELSGCLRFKCFWFDRCISIEVGSVSKLHLKAESLEMCPLHIGNNFPNFRFACFYEENGPSLIGNLGKLLSFGLCACTNLERFSQSICGLRCLTKLTLEGSIPEAPKDLDRLECLEELHLLSTQVTHVPDNICKLKHLKCLKLECCWLLEKLPEDLGRLECLEKLILSECVFLRHIPDSICTMKRLQYFLLRSCIAVEKLPEEIGRLRCLKELNIEGTNIRHLPESIFEVKGLLIVGYRWLLQSYGFTSQIQTTIQTKGGETVCYVEL